MADQSISFVVILIPFKTNGDYFKFVLLSIFLVLIYVEFLSSMKLTEATACSLNCCYDFARPSFLIIPFPIYTLGVIAASDNCLFPLFSKMLILEYLPC